MRCVWSSLTWACTRRARFDSDTSEDDNKRAQLLSMVVPEHITRELIERVRRRRDGTAVLEGDALIAHAHRQVALCFIDMCDFTLLSAALGAEDVVRFLGEFFTLLDELSDK